MLLLVACAAGSKMRNESAPAAETLVVAEHLAVAEQAVSPSEAHDVVNEAVGREVSEPAEPPSGLSREQLWAYYNRLRNDPYPLDVVPRWLSAEQTKPSCEPELMVSYGGQLLTFAGAVQIRPEFVDRLVRFERIVDELAHEIYGRAPSRVRHLGAFSCRTSRFRSRRISEHALGNAIDISGFDFAPAPKELRSELPPELRHHLRVRVESHWNAPEHGVSAAHRRFLRELSERVVEEGVFRVALGPSHRGHANHFHFDMSPWRYVNL